VRGKVVDRISENPVAGVELFIYPEDTSKTDPNPIVILSHSGDGAFEFKGLLSGSYVIRANSRTRNKPEASGRMEVNVRKADEDNIVLFLSQSAEISGTVSADEDDLQALLHDATRAMTGNRPAGGRLQISFNSLEPNAIGMGPTRASM